MNDNQELLKNILLVAQKPQSRKKETHWLGTQPGSGEVREPRINETYTLLKIEMQGEKKF